MWNVDLEGCKSLCVVDEKCKAIEVALVRSYRRCELHSAMPSSTLQMPGFHCLIK